MNKSESIAKIAAALVKAQSKMGNATKDAKNPFFKSKYADLNAIREAVLPPLNENGVSVLQFMTYNEGRSYIETTLLHESGEYLTSLTEIVHGKDKPSAQDVGSAQSYARRYGLQALLCVGAEDDDGNNASGRGAIPATPSTSETNTQAASVAPKTTSSFKKPPTSQTTSTGDGW